MGLVKYFLPFLSHKKTELSTYESILRNASSITVLISSLDSIDLVLEDISFFRSIFPNRVFSFVCASSTASEFCTVEKDSDVIVYPISGNSHERKDFCHCLQKISADIVYCRVGIDDTFFNRIICDIRSDLVIVFGDLQTNIKPSGQILRIEDSTSTLKKLLPFFALDAQNDESTNVRNTSRIKNKTESVEEEKGI